MPENTDNLKKVVSEQEEIENLAGNLRRNGLSGSISESTELAKRIIARQHMMYGYISAKNPEMQKEAERFKTPGYNVAEEEGTTLKDLMSETGESKEQEFSFMPQKAEPIKPDETVPTAVEKPSSEKKPDETVLPAAEKHSSEKKTDEKKEEESTSETQQSQNSNL